MDGLVPNLRAALATDWAEKLGALLMERYKKAFLLSALVISIPCALLLFASIAASSLPDMVVWGGLLCLWWLAYFCLRRSRAGSFGLSFTLAALVWLPLLAQTGGRVVFVIQNGGMDRADGYGSPLAFLMGVAFEQFLFLPLSFVIVSGVMVLLERRGQLRPSDCETDS